MHRSQGFGDFAGRGGGGGGGRRSSSFTILAGEVRLEPQPGFGVARTLHRGEFFGEMSLLSGRPRTERAIAGPACILIETPRRTMVKLMSSNEDVRKSIDWTFIVRELAARCSVS